MPLYAPNIRTGHGVIVILYILLRRYRAEHLREADMIRLSI
jgi:hypothetical protein